jgi:toxin ParE1/3/4
MKIKWLETALDNIAHIADRLSENDPAAARRMVTKIRLSIDNLTKHPTMGRPGRVKGTRELVIVGTFYIVIYKVNNNNIEILRVLHSSQRWPS